MFNYHPSILDVNAMLTWHKKLAIAFFCDTMKGVTKDVY